MQSAPVRQSIRGRQFTGLVKGGHIGHERGTRDDIVSESLYSSPIGLRIHPTIVSVSYDLS
jgi:hypothetical protein